MPAEVTCRQSYAFIKVQLSEAHAVMMPWYVGVSSVGSSLNYYLKAWCSDDSTFSALSKPCISVGTSGCLDIRENFVCAADQVFLKSDQAVVEVQAISLQSGEWKYHTFNVSIAKSRILVEMSRSRGDVMLFLKPGDIGHKQEALPSEFDIDKYADKLGYMNRQNYHHYFFIGTGQFIIGIYNNDACVEETSLVNLTISTASPHTSSYLCPRNCSYPNGKCISDLLCLCEADYGGKFCEGSLASPNPKQNISGWLFPGQVAYFKMSKPKGHNGGNWSIKFSRHGNNAILLANNGGFPTLSNYSLAVSGNTSTDLVEYHGDSDTHSGELVFGVFNLDYIVHQTSFYDITVYFPGGKGLSTGLIILVTVSSSFLLCFAVAIVERILHFMNSQSLDLESGTLDDFSNGEDQNVSNQGGLDKGVIESFPLVLFEDIDRMKDKAQCPICLGEYVLGDILRKIPFCCHLFHVDCIEKWLVCSGSCPVCRVGVARLNERHWDRSYSDPLLRTGNPSNGSVALTELFNTQGDWPR